MSFIVVIHQKKKNCFLIFYYHLWIDFTLMSPFFGLFKFLEQTVKISNFLLACKNFKGRNSEVLSLFFKKFREKILKGKKILDRNSERKILGRKRSFKKILDQKF